MLCIRIIQQIFAWFLPWAKPCTVLCRESVQVKTLSWGLSCCHSQQPLFSHPNPQLAQLSSYTFSLVRSNRLLSFVSALLCFCREHWTLQPVPLQVSGSQMPSDSVLPSFSICSLFCSHRGRSPSFNGFTGCYMFILRNLLMLDDQINLAVQMFMFFFL